MILYVDMGNSFTKVYYGSDLITLETSNIENEINMLDNCAFLLEGAIISSVSINHTSTIYNYIKNRFNIEPLIVNKDMNFSVKYPENNELGSDLLALVEGAYKRSKSFIGISAGTATVFILVKDGIFMGASIAPGMRISFDALINKASLLNDIEMNGEFSLLSNNTIECLRSGAINGNVFLIDGFIEAIKKEYMEDFNVYITGGLSTLIEERLKSKVIVDKDLIKDGLEVLYELNGGDHL